MDADRRDIRHRQERDPNRPGHYSPEVGGKNLRTRNPTVYADHLMDSKRRSEKELVEKDPASQRSEIDLSHLSPRTDFVGVKAKGKPGEEKEVISVQSTAEAALGSEPEPVEKSSPQEESKPVSVKRRKPGPRKAEKSSEASLGVKGKSKGGRVAKKTKPRISKPPLEQVMVSKGVAYLEGNTIRVVGGTKLRPGDQVKIGEKEFVLKARAKKNKLPYLFVFVSLVVGLLISSQLLKGEGSGKLIGVVLEPETKTLLSDAKVHIKELGEEVRSNRLGFFIFDAVPSGSYTLCTSLGGYQATEDKVTIAKKQPTTLTVLLPVNRLTRLSGKSSEGAIPPVGASPGTEGQSRYGAMRIESNVSDPAVTVDDWRLGMGNRTYQGIYVGKHTVKITKQGYQDFTQQVKIKSGETLSLKINLSEAERGTPIPQTSEEWIALARSQMNSHDFSAAANSYSQALILDPKSAEAFLGRGLVYLQVDDRFMALADLGKAAEHYTQEGDYHKAIVCYTNLLGLDEQNLDFLYNRGLCHLRLGQYQESICDLEETVELDKEFFLGYLNLGKLFYKLGDYELSLKHYKKAKKLDSTNPQVYAGLAKAYFAKGKKSSAKKNRKKFKEFSTYVDRERMKQDPKWRELLKGIGEKVDPES